MGEVHEVVVFRLRARVTREEFVRAAEPTQRWLRAQPGLLERTLLAPLGDGDTWIDIGRWRSLAEAEEASKRFEAECGGGEFEQMIDPASVQMVFVAPEPLEVDAPRAV